MTVRLSVPLRNTFLDTLVTQLTGGVVKLYSGAQPANVAAAPSGLLLATVPLGSPVGVVTGGVLTFTTPVSATAVATGTAGWARFLTSADGSRMDVSVSLAAGAGDVKVDNTAVLTGATVTITALSVTAPSP